MQKEVQVKFEKEIIRQQISEKLKDKQEKAEKREKEIRKEKLQKLITNEKKFEGIITKAKEKEELRIKQHGEVQQKQNEKSQQIAQNKAKLIEDRVRYLKVKDDELKKKISQIRECKSTANVAEEERRFFLLQDMEKNRIKQLKFVIVESKKSKNDQYIRGLVRELKKKNTKKKKKIEEIRQMQQEDESNKKKEYRRLQNAIFQSIIHNKRENYEIHKKKRMSQTQTNKMQTQSHSGSFNQMKYQEEYLILLYKFCIK